jgi:hypothetical protein
MDLNSIKKVLELITLNTQDCKVIIKVSDKNYSSELCLQFNFIGSLLFINKEVKKGADIIKYPLVIGMPVNEKNLGSVLQIIKSKLNQHLNNERP